MEHSHKITQEKEEIIYTCPMQSEVQQKMPMCPEWACGACADGRKRKRGTFRPRESGR